MKTYAKIKRICHLNNLIKRSCFNMSQIVYKAEEKFGCCSASNIESLIKQMRTDFDAPIKYNRLNDFYYYDEEFDLKKIIMDDLEL